MSMPIDSSLRKVSDASSVSFLQDETFPTENTASISVVGKIVNGVAGFISGCSKVLSGIVHVVKTSHQAAEIRADAAARKSLGLELRGHDLDKEYEFSMVPFGPSEVAYPIWVMRSYKEGGYVYKAVNDIEQLGNYEPLTEDDFLKMLISDDAVRASIAAQRRTEHPDSTLE